MKLWEIDWDDCQTRYKFDDREWRVGERIKDLFDGITDFDIFHSYTLEDLVKADFKPINLNSEKDENKLTKADKHKELCEKLNETYIAKNNDYGDSFSIMRKEYPNAILIRLFDKYNRLKTLLEGREQKVANESIRDTLLDMANYCVMEIIEMMED